MIAVPKNGYLSDSYYPKGWACERGYRAAGDACVEIVIPANAYLSESTADKGWTCRRGFRAAGDACVAISVPANGYLDDAKYGKGWKCERGYRVAGATCVAVTPPANAHVNSVGDDWECNPPYRRSRRRLRAPKLTCRSCPGNCRNSISQIAGYCRWSDLT